MIIERILSSVTLALVIYQKCTAGQNVIGDSCQQNEECVGEPGRNSVCTKTGVCDCRDMYTPSASLDDCLEIRNEIGGDCLESQQCQQGKPGGLSECTPDGKCNCTKDAVSSGQGDQCYKKASIVGEECMVGVQCIANLKHSHCLNGICECFPGAVANGNGTKCLLKKKFGEVCQENVQCSHVEQGACLRNLANTDDICKCADFYTPNPTPDIGDICMKWALVIGDPCNDHSRQCNGYLENVTCLGPEGSRLCRCDINHVPSLNLTKCLPNQVFLNETCEESQQCQVANSVCLQTEKICGCDSLNGYVAGVDNPNQCLPVRSKIGEACQESVQCKNISLISDSVNCRENICGINCPNSPATLAH